MLQVLAQTVDRIDLAVQKSGLQRAKSQIMFVVALAPDIGGVDHGVQHGRVTVPVIRVREFDNVDCVHRGVLLAEG